MIPWFLTVLFLLTSISLMWYVRELLIRFRYLSINSYELSKGIERYKEHLQSVYELPMFYGDETLKGLMNHTRDLSDDLTELQQVFFLSDDIREEENDKEEKEEVE